MRLLNIETFVISEFHGSDIPPYLIASHRWFATEPTFKDVCKQRNQACPGYKKIQGFCEFALKAQVRAMGISHLWIDTCCIDKSSSAELTESINSMMRFYGDSQCCLVYLADVGPLEPDRSETINAFRQSEWFRRAWTLQELLAPMCVLFLNRDWEIIGHKGKVKRHSAAHKLYGEGKIYDLTKDISEITGIRYEVLQKYKRSKSLDFREKWSWVANRKTTREEDLAYCLLGIFNVHMPLVYGEGLKAHDRLLREIKEKDKALTRKMKKKQAKKAANEQKQLRTMLFYEGRYSTLPIEPPQSPGLGERYTTDMQNAAIVSLLLRNIAQYPGVSHLPAINTADVLRRSGYLDPGEILHQALYYVNAQCRLIREAFVDGHELQWSQSETANHIIRVLIKQGHSREVAVAMLATYLDFDMADLTRLHFPYIEPVVPQAHGQPSDAPCAISQDTYEAEASDGVSSGDDSALGLSIESSRLCDDASKDLVTQISNNSRPSYFPDGGDATSDAAIGITHGRNEGSQNRRLHDSFDAFTQLLIFS